MDSQGENDELYPIAVLIDELKVCWCRRYRGDHMIWLGTCHD